MEMDLAPPGLVMPSLNKPDARAGRQRMQSNPKVSVAICCYNHEPYIETAILSALRQETEFPFEVIVGDDCSTDGSREIIKRLREEHGDRLLLIKTDHNMGGRENFLNIFRACRGEYVANLDGDDYWLDHSKLKAQVDLMESDSGLSMCCHPAIWCDEQGHFIGRTRNRPRHRIRSFGFKDMIEENFAPSCSILFRRELFRGFPAWMPDYPAVPGDWIMTLGLSRQGEIGYLKAHMAAYRIHNRGTWSSEDNLRRLKAISRVCSNLLPELDPASAKAARISQACVRIRIAAAHAIAGRQRRARLYLRYAWAQGWRAWPVWRQSLVFVLDVLYPGLSQRLRDLTSPRVKLRSGGDNSVDLPQMIDP